MCFYGVALWKNYTKGSLIINLDLVTINVLKYFLAILNFTVLLPYFWNCLCLVFVLLYIIVNTGFVSSGSIALTMLLNT